ncbi:MAG TPA: hydrogenase nickel incorporation protein HypB [Hydrogenophaga sp.]|uniref:hydrogenase nickel incorporation protein HypB n=1 Tax=Hydrogenophaga sp. TaxID=1904254 RepID=UPI002B98DE9B|nr:hydrogenase nickel incorporation protein HypB [Hydrogenophaga sp.]HMN91952.1 hydrogenase nickel incorporation protein HypB [Hydrogenophaga sp.]HMP08754.1 hydrogenase nickel incorporation protein HypB [Hydrogenophaga sp.]
MCVVCGCSDNSPAHARPVQQAGGEPGVIAVNPANGDLHFGTGAARVSVPGMSQERAIKLETDILGANNRVAQQNRAHFEAHGVTALNFVSSPGSGKTTLLCATIEALKARQPGLHVAVIEGDQQTSFDADRIRATGAPAIQVNTGKGCHLDAPMVAEAFAQLHTHEHAHDHSHDHGHDHHDHAHGHHHHHHHEAHSLLFIENVGNLVCPAVWDLGEAAKVAILSVTEGEDKPLKYPDMFAASQLMILNKTDLLPHVTFDVARCIDLARRVNPAIEVIQLSATTGEGMDAWLHWLEHKMGALHHHHHEPVTDQNALQARVSQLEAELAQARAALSKVSST